MSTTLKINYLRALTKLGKQSVVARSVFGHPYRISLGDTFSENPYYNPSANVGEVLATAAWVSALDKPVIYDIGAHCGFIASQLAAILKKQNPVIYSFEPVAPTFSDLVLTITALGLHNNVHPIAIALSNTPGFVKLNYSKWNSMLAQIISDERSNNSRSGEEVYIAPSQTLDLFMEAAQFPQVIKIDVEGWEANVFHGAARVLADKRINEVGICLEWNPPALKDVGSDAETLYQSLSAFRFFYLNDYEGQKLPELAEVEDPRKVSHVCNLFAIHRQSARTEAWKKKFVELKEQYGVKVS